MNGFRGRQRVRRIAERLVLQDGESGVVQVNGDWFEIKQMTADCLLSVNGERAATVTVGDRLQGVPGESEIQDLKFTNNSGDENVIVVLFGLGQHWNTANVSIVNPNFTLSNQDKTDIKTGVTIASGNVTSTPAAVAKAIIIDTVLEHGTASEDATFEDALELAIYNAGTGNVLIGTNPLEPGAAKTFRASLPGQRLADISVNTSTNAGAKAIVTGTK